MCILNTGLPGIIESKNGSSNRMIEFLIKLGRRVGMLNALRRAKKDSFTRLKNKNIRNVLVMCYGNIYRSPFVEYLLQLKLNDSYRVKSAGFYPKENRKSPENHVKMASEFSIDLSSHVSKLVNQSLIEWSDVIIIMDRYNWYRLAAFGNNALNKAIWLGVFSKSNSVEIVDPYDMSQHEAKNILIQLSDASEALVERLLHQS